MGIVSKVQTEVWIIDLSNFLTNKKSPEFFPKVVSFSDPWPSCGIPLFFCPSYEQLKIDGFNIPREFVVETSLRLNPECEVEDCDAPKDFCEVARENIRARVKLLGLLDGKRVATDDIRDWCSGAFRRYLFLDSEVHGTAGTMDLKGPCDEDFYRKWFSAKEYLADKRQERNRRILRNRFVHPKEDQLGLNIYNDPMLKYRKFFLWLYPKDFLEIRKFMGLGLKSSQQWRTVKNAVKNYFGMSAGSPSVACKEDEVHLPKESGLALKFCSPRERIRILVVDDSAVKEVEKLREKVKEAKLEGLFEFETLELNAGNKPNSEFVREAVGAIENVVKIRGEEGSISQSFYDCVLLDLCLGEPAGADLSGYQLIRYFRQFMPLSPVIVFSEHEDMGHITRAFDEGACWFLKKSTAGEKLARHFMSLLARVNWNREWKSLGGLYHVDVEGRDPYFKRRFERKDEWKYLTVKCLETLPGQYIQVNQMGGGISSAVTFKAKKGVEKQKGYAQSPVIIKIDTVFNTSMEYERYFRFIRPYIANEAGRVEQRARVLDRDNSAIVYTFAGRTDAAHHLDTLESLIAADMLSRETCDYEKYKKTFDSLFDEILPKLHGVTPEQEFRDAKAWPVVKDGKSGLSCFSDFPNHCFGELDPDADEVDPWFLSNYSYRMPIEKRIEDFTIATPEILKGSEKKGVESLEVFGVYKDRQKSGDDIEAPYRYVIECQRKCASGRYEKVRLSGYRASFYARFRRHIFPGMVLPVVKTEELDRGELEMLSWGVRKVGKRKQCRLVFKVPNLKQANANGEMRDVKGFDSGCVSGFLEEEMLLLPQKTVITIRDALLRVYAENKPKFRCPCGIVHGDLNFRNIMIESRVVTPEVKKFDVTKTLTDVWLIDFARTRRDIIAHDFNVAFTSMLPLLFQQDLVGKCEKDKNVDLKMIRTREQKDYVDKVNDRIEPFLTHVLFDKTDAVADVIADDKRLVFVYRILRRIRKAALQAGISEEMYLLTTALSCLYAFKIYYNQKMPDAACALVLTALLCERHLCETFKKA